MLQIILKYKTISSHIICQLNYGYILTYCSPKKTFFGGGFGYPKNVLGTVNFSFLALSFLILKLRILEKFSPNQVLF